MRAFRGRALFRSPDAGLMAPDPSRGIARWRDDGHPTTPHVAVYERDVTTNNGAITFGAERRVARFEGARQIIEWVRQGAPLPANEKR